MANNDMVKITCYGQKEERSRKDAISFYMDAILNTEGSERDRYINVLTGLKLGLREVSDGC